MFNIFYVLQFVVKWCNLVVIVMGMNKTTHQTAPKIAKRPNRGERVVGCSEGDTEDDEEEV